MKVSQAEIAGAEVEKAVKTNPSEARSPVQDARDVLLNEGQAAEFLKLSVRTLQQWRVSGRGPLFTKLSRAVRYRRADLDAYVARGVAQSTTQADAKKNVA